MLSLLPQVVMQSPLLVVVHPGSLCGSADFNLREEAEGARDAVIQTLHSHCGPVVVIDGEMSDELDRYGDLDAALRECVEVAGVQGFAAERIEGLDLVLCDDRHFSRTMVPALERLLEVLGADHPVTLTGAWYHPDDGSGCVGTVRQVMEETGFTRISISPCCARLFDEPEPITPAAASMPTP